MKTQIRKKIKGAFDFEEVEKVTRPDRTDIEEIEDIPEEIEDKQPIKKIIKQGFFQENAKKADDIFEELGITSVDDEFVDAKQEKIPVNEILSPVMLQKRSTVIQEDIFLKPVLELESRLNHMQEPKGFFKKFFFDREKRKIKEELYKINLENKKYLDTLNSRNLKKVVKNMENLVMRRGFLDIKGWKNQIADSKNPGKTLLINMELRNGFHAHFQIILSDKWFDYEDGRYIIDDTFKYYSISSKLWCLDYHQDCCIPLKRRVDVNDILKAVAESAEIDTETSINPKSLKIFMESDIIQKVMKSAEMDSWIKFVKLMLIIIVAINAITLLLILKSVFG